MCAFELNMPLAVPDVGTDPPTFYASFAGRISASWAPGAGLNVWLASGEPFNRLHAPTKAAMRFYPAGSIVAGSPVATHTIVLQTWPLDYVSIRDSLRTEVPSAIHFANVDAASVRAAVTPLFADIGRPAAVVDDFISGNGLLRVEAGSRIGAAAVAPGGPGGLTNNIGIVLRDQSGGVINPVLFFAAIADHLAIDKALHPLLSQLDLTGWLEVITLDEDGAPLAGESYVLYLSDGTTRQGNSDPNGRIYESGLPSGNWGIDMPNHPAFTIVEQ